MTTQDRGWAVLVQGDGQDEVLLVLVDRLEGESIGIEMRRRGWSVRVERAPLDA